MQVLTSEDFTISVSSDWLKFYVNNNYTHFKCFDCGEVKPISDIHIEVTELENNMVCKDCETELEIIVTYKEV